MANVSSIKLPNNTTYNIVDKTSGYTKNTGTVTSVAVSAGTGISVSGSPITSNGTITISNSGVTGVKGSAESSYRTGQVNLTAANIGAVARNDELLTTNPFAPPSVKGPYISKIDNAFYVAHKRFNVTYTGDSTSNVSTIFDGSYESQFSINAGGTVTITIDCSATTTFPGYPYGNILISFYHNMTPQSVSGRVYCNYEPHGIGWHDITFTPLSDNGTYQCVYKGYNGNYAISKFEITINAQSSTKTYVTQIEMHLDRPDASRTPFVSKYQAETLYYDLTAPNFIGDVAGIATSAIKVGDRGGTFYLYPQANNEINFGGSASKATVFFGYRAVDNQTAPTKYVFSGSTGTASLQCNKVYLGSGTTAYIDSTSYTGSAAKVNNHTVNSDVPSGAKFTDTVTTATTTGSGNAVTAVTASNGALTITKGTTFLTSHQDISGKADKSATVSTVAYDSTNKKITKTINGTTTDVVTVTTLKSALGSMPASDVYSWAKASTKPTYTASEVGAQPTLVSGTNIKTINNQSLLGSGDISISGDVSDVQVDGTSIVNQQGVANINPAIFLDFFYRVGSYYETSDSTFNPNVEWGGTWELETEGQVHVSAGSNYAVSGALSNTSDGGSKNAIVPTHNHEIKAKATGGPSENTSGGQSQNHTHSPSNASNFMYYDSDVSGANVGRRNIGSGSGSYYTWTAAKTDALKASAATSGTSQGHTHSLQNHTHTLGAHSTEDKGVSGTNKNMQPYIVVYRWHRTA